MEKDIGRQACQSEVQSAKTVPKTQPPFERASQDPAPTLQQSPLDETADVLHSAVCGLIAAVLTAVGLAGILLLYLLLQ